MYQAKDLSDWNLTSRASDKEKKSKVGDHVITVDLNTEPLEAQSGKTILLGFACDEGVKRNNGRPGAKDGPAEIRKALGKIAWHGEADFLLDAGDVQCEKHELEKTQASYSQFIDQFLSKELFPIGIGGGHEIAIAGYRGIRSAFQKNSLAIINIDPHFDLRSIMAQAPNSGTSFYQMALDSQESNTPFHYLSLGIQDFSNAKELFQTADNFGVKWRARDEMMNRTFEETKNEIEAFIYDKDMVYLSICMDVFNECLAPGVSAPNPMGLSSDMVLDTIHYIVKSGKLIYLDIAETNPRFDIDGRTARLAATIIYQVMKWRMERKSV